MTLAAILLAGCGTFTPTPITKRLDGEWVAAVPKGKEFSNLGSDKKPALILKDKGILEARDLPNILSAAPFDVYSGEGTWEFLAKENCVKISFEQNAKNFQLQFTVTSANSIFVELGDPDELRRIEFFRVPKK